MKVEVKMDGRERKGVRKRKEGRGTSRDKTRNSNHLGLLFT